MTADEDCFFPECQEYVKSEAFADEAAEAIEPCPKCERPAWLCECLWSCPLCGKWEEDCKCQLPF